MLREYFIGSRFRCPNKRAYIIIYNISLIEGYISLRCRSHRCVKKIDSVLRTQYCTTVLCTSYGLLPRFATKRVGCSAVQRAKTKDESTSVLQYYIYYTCLGCTWTLASFSSKLIYNKRFLLEGTLDPTFLLRTLPII